MLLVNHLRPSRCIKALFYIPENRPNFPTSKGFRRQISMKMFYEYMVIFFNLSPTSSHFHPLQVENCDSNSRLVVDEDDNSKFRLERVKRTFHFLCYERLVRKGLTFINLDTITRYDLRSEDHVDC